MKDPTKEIGGKPVDGNLARMDATGAAEAIREGRITSEALVGACLDRIAALEDRVGTWAFLDPGHALKQAREADRARREGKVLGAFHGMPMGVQLVGAKGDDDRLLRTARWLVDLLARTSYPVNGSSTNNSDRAW